MTFLSPAEPDRGVVSNGNVLYSSVPKKKTVRQKKTPDFPEKFLLVETVLGRRGQAVLSRNGRVFPLRIRDSGIFGKGFHYVLRVRGPIFPRRLRRWVFPHVRGRNSIRTEKFRANANEERIGICPATWV